MTIAYILIFMVCILLILIVLVQNSKGGGLASGFTGSQIMGVRKTADFLEKATWTLAGALIVFCIITNLILPRQQEVVKRSVLQDEIQNAIDPNAVPKVPTAAPKDANQKPFQVPFNDKKKK
jgi:preprotein translocase subunit SecG